MVQAEATDKEMLYAVEGRDFFLWGGGGGPVTFGTFLIIIPQIFDIVETNIFIGRSLGGYFFITS